MVAERRNLQARVTDEAGTAWDQTCFELGVTYTALVEAVGRAMARGWRPTPSM